MYLSLTHILEVFREEQKDWDYRFLDLSLIKDEQSIISEGSSFLVLTKVCPEDMSAAVYMKLFNEKELLRYVNNKVEDYRQQCIDHYGDDDGFEYTFTISNIVENYMSNSLTVANVSRG